MATQLANELGDTSLTAKICRSRYDYILKRVQLEFDGFHHVREWPRRSPVLRQLLEEAMMTQRELNTIDKVDSWVDADAGACPRCQIYRQ